MIDIKDRLIYTEMNMRILKVIDSLTSEEYQNMTIKEALLNIGFKEEVLSSDEKLKKAFAPLISLYSSFMFLHNKDKKFDHIDDSVFERYIKGEYKINESRETKYTSEAYLPISSDSEASYINVSPVEIRKINSYLNSNPRRIVSFIRNAIAHGHYSVNDETAEVRIYKYNNGNEIDITIKIDSLVLLSSVIFGGKSDLVNNKIDFLISNETNFKCNSYSELRNELKKFRYAEITNFSSADGEVLTYDQKWELFFDKVNNITSMDDSLNAKMEIISSALHKYNIKYNVLSLSDKQIDEVMNLARLYEICKYKYPSTPESVGMWIREVITKHEAINYHLGNLFFPIIPRLIEKDYIEKVKVKNLFYGLKELESGKASKLDTHYLTNIFVLLKAHALLVYNKENVFKDTYNYYEEVNLDTSKFDFIIPKIEEIRDSDVNNISKQLKELEKTIDNEADSILDLSNNLNKIRGENDDIKKQIIKKKKEVARLYKKYCHLNQYVFKINNETVDLNREVSPYHFLKHLRNSLVHANSEFSVPKNTKMFGDQIIALKDLNGDETTFKCTVRTEDLNDFLDNEIYGKLFLGIVDSETKKLKLNNN